MASILTGGLVAFIVATGISFGFFYPTFKEREVKISENTTASLLQHMENTLSLVENYMENVAATVEQNNDIQNYLKNPDAKNSTNASVRLNNLTSYMGMIRGIAIAGQNAPTIDSMTNIGAEDYKIIESDEFQKMTETGFSRSYSSVYQTKIGSKSYFTVAYARNYYLNNQWCSIVMFVNLNNTLKDMTWTGRKQSGCLVSGRQHRETSFYGYAAGRRHCRRQEGWLSRTMIERMTVKVNGKL